MLTKYLTIIISSILLFSCNTNLKVIDNLSETNFELINQDSALTDFPDVIKGKIGIVGYIFTNCPDICPLTTNSMRLIQERLNKGKISNIKFVSISFDPDVDKPSILKEFAEIRDLDLSNWDFLTGDKNIIEKLLKKVGVVAFVGDSTTFEDGTKTYYYVHTDRIQLIDQEGRIRKNYLGSKININEIIDDVKELL